MGVRDLSDHGIVPGCLVVYAATKVGGSAVLKYGIVTRIVSDTVRIISVDWSGWPIAMWHLQKGGNEMALGYLGRLLIVTPEQVPEEARVLLVQAFKDRMEKTSHV